MTIKDELINYLYEQEFVDDPTAGHEKIENLAKGILHIIDEQIAILYTTGKLGNHSTEAWYRIADALRK